jgi:hypothetical protein
MDDINLNDLERLEKLFSITMFNLYCFIKLESIWIKESEKYC